MTLLSIRMALKHDLQCSVAELVYGSTLCLHWEFFQQSPPVDDPASLFWRLKNAMLQFRATPVRRKVHTDNELSSCTHVFVRKDSVRKPLQPPYDGPYRVLSREHKYFQLDLNGRQDTGSVDRLKVAHLDAASEETTPPPSVSSPRPSTSPASPPPTLPPPTRTTRSRRRVHFRPFGYFHSLAHGGGGM